jgi:pilus assembly protein CpaE
MTQEFDFLNFDTMESGEYGSEGSQFGQTEPVDGSTGLTIVDADQAVCDYLAGLFSQATATASSLAEAEAGLGPGPTVVVLGPSCAEPDDLATVEQWGRTRPNVAAVLVTSELSTQLLHKALRAGVKDVLSAPIDQALLQETVERVADALPKTGPTPAAAAPTDLGSFDAGEQGQVISVFSTKGGSGKSVAATNLGVVLARRSDRPVVVIDGHIQFGDVAVMLKLQPQHTVIDAIAQLDSLDSALIERLLTVHEPSGLYVLPAPLEPTFADQVTGKQLSDLIEAVRGFAGHVIVDLPAIFNELVLSVIEQSDEIVLVAGLDIPNIKNVKIGLSTLQMLNVPKERLHLVLNRSDSKVKLNVSEVERTLGVEAAAHVPSDVVVPISVNKGSPVVLSAPKSGPARAFEAMASRFLDGATTETAPQQGRRKFFG